VSVAEERSVNYPSSAPLIYAGFLRPNSRQSRAFGFSQRISTPMSEEFTCEQSIR
jgi:hypothetical protein